MAKKKPQKAYNSPGHVNDHPAFNMPIPSGGDMAGQELGQPMPPGGQMGAPLPPGIGG